MLRFEVVDVFADRQRPFTGNPLAVVLDADGLPTESLQAIAREFNLSETAFPFPPDGEDADYRLRIFTPSAELPFAGHPSVGAAWVLARLGRIAARPVRQACRAGVVDLVVCDDSTTLTGGPPQVGGRLESAVLLDAVGLSPADLAGPEPRTAGAGLDFVYLPVREEAVGRAEGDPAKLRRIPGGFGMSVFCYDGGGHAHARVFTGDVGEDPATGSAALGLGAYLAAAGLVGDGETSYVVAQGAEIGRPSTLECSMRVEGGRATQCRVGGGVVRIASGEIAVP